MPPIVIALVIVFGGLWLIRKYAKLSPKQSRVFTSKLVSLGLMLLAGLLMLRGQFGLGSGLLVFGMGLYGTSELPDLKSFWKARQNTTASVHPIRDFKREEALAILGLRPGASDDEIRKAHRQMMKDHHPDAGGSAELASKINAAKDVLLG
jgi:hypothetical protein